MNYYNYFTEIEEHFVRRRGKHLYVSPLDWSLIATWRDTRIPLNIALRGIDIAMDGFFARQDRRQSKVNTLFFCHDAVMSEYARYVESHLGEPGEGGSAPADDQASPRETDAGGQPDKSDVLALLNKRISEIETLQAKHSSGDAVHSAAGRALARLEEIRNEIEAQAEIEYEALERDLTIVDESLIEQLRGTLESDQTSAWQKEAKTELKIYRKQLPRETYEKILHNYMRGKVHNHFRVGELSLFQL
jgi:hypothetical protein